MKAEQEKISAKVRAVSMHLNGGKLQLPAEEESCYVVLVAESGCTCSTQSRPCCSTG